MTKALEELIEISRYYGNDKDFTIASGGNTSVKDGDVMYVKASGYELGKIGEEGYVALDRQMLERLATREYSEDEKEREAQVKSDLLKSRIFPELNQRPSVEASVHHAIRYKFVVHLHPTRVNAVMCSKNARKTMEELFGDEAVFVPYITPGYILYKEIERLNEAYFATHGKYPNIFFLQNHGVFVGAETAEEIKAVYENINKRIGDRIGNFHEISAISPDEKFREVIPALRAAFSSAQKLVVGKLRNNSLIDTFLKDDEKLAMIDGPFTPDGIVFCGSKPLVVEGEAPEEIVADFMTKLENYRQDKGYDPKIVVIRSLGVFAPGYNPTAAEVALDVFEDVLKIALYSLNFGGSNFMTESDAKFIEQWEVEAYRRSLITKGAGEAGFENRVVAVTGGAQGFGKGIVEGLLAKGACVQVIDLNEGVGKKTVEALEAEDYEKKVIFTKANITQAGDLQGAVDEVIAAFGGVDVLISNAGVLRAGSLEDLDEKDFDFVTSVNYKGYYLSTKYYTKPMKLQHNANPVMMMDVIQINSKSGLAGSNKNYAYAGGKFGGIGLTQSFALELALYNIKVNSICPGNFFEGPLWADPERGLFVQYLNAGKVPGAKTIEDVKEFYESKVPMGRGCRPEDVVKAIEYVVQQQYETGQAVPVTGGQIMLH